MDLRSSDWRSLLTLGGEIVERTTQEGVQAAAGHALRGLYGLIGAEEGFIVFSCRTVNRRHDLLKGWRPLRTIYDRSEERRRLAAEFYRDPRFLLHDPVMQALARGAGQARVYRRGDLVSRDAWEHLPSYNEVLRPLGVRDRIYAGSLVAPGVEVHYGFDRIGGRRNFTRRERDIVGAATQQLAWFSHRLAVVQGLAGSILPPLSVRERQTLMGLLGGQPEKLIAAALGISTLTLHQYVKAVYRKLRVTSRPELMARFIGHPMPALNRDAGGTDVAADATWELIFRGL